MDKFYIILLDLVFWDELDFVDDVYRFSIICFWYLLPLVIGLTITR